MMPRKMFGFELATPGSAFRSATDCAIRPGANPSVILLGNLCVYSPHPPHLAWTMHAE